MNSRIAMLQAGCLVLQAACLAQASDPAWAHAEPDRAAAAAPRTRAPYFMPAGSQATTPDGRTGACLDSSNFDVKLFRFAYGLNKTTYGVIFRAVTVVNSPRDIKDARLAGKATLQPRAAPVSESFMATLREPGTPFGELAFLRAVLALPQ